MTTSTRRSVYYTFGNPSAINCEWTLFAGTYASDIEAYEAVARCRVNYPEAVIRFTTDRLFTRTGGSK